MFHLTQMLFSCLFPAGELKLHVKPYKNLSMDRICIPITTEKNDQFLDKKSLKVRFSPEKTLLELLPVQNVTLDVSSLTLKNCMHHILNAAVIVFNLLPSL